MARFEFSQVQMGVPFKILLYAPSAAAAEKAATAAYSRVAELNRLMSDYDAASELSRLSAASPTREPISLSDDLWFVLDRSQKLAAASDGAFDITVGPYVRLWRRARREKQMPSDERLGEARAAVGYRNLELDAATHTAKLLRPQMRLDLGGIGAGYAVDEALAVLRKHGVDRALVDASGDVGVSGPPPGERGWRIGVAPLTPDGPPSKYLLLADAAVTTSGDAFQHVELGGHRYSHIVDPRTGLGLTDRSTVVVVAPDCITADSLATAVSVLGPAEGLKLIESTPDAAAWILRDEDGTTEFFESKRFRKLPELNVQVNSESR